MALFDKFKKKKTEESKDEVEKIVGEDDLPSMEEVLAARAEDGLPEDTLAAQADDLPDAEELLAALAKNVTPDEPPGEGEASAGEGETPFDDDDFNLSSFVVGDETEDFSLISTDSVTHIGPPVKDEDISPEDLERIAALAEKMEENILIGNVTDFSAAGMLNVTEGDDGIDDELWALIQKDRTMMDNLRETEDIKRDFVGDADIYDTVERNPNAVTVVKPAADTPPRAPTEEKPAKEKRKLTLPTVKIGKLQIGGTKIGEMSAVFENSSIKYYIIIGAMALVLIIAGGFLLNLSAQISSKRDALEAQLGRVVEQPDFKRVPNDANYIYVHENAWLDESPLIVEKILIDAKETTLFFNKQLNFNKYRVTLTDNGGYAYPPDLYYMLGETNIKRNRTALHFMPLRPGVSTLTVNVENRETGETGEFKLRVTKGVVLPHDSHLSEMVNVGEGASLSNSSIWIDDIQFGTGQTQLTFSIRPKSNGQLEVSLDPDKPLEISLRESGVRVLPITESPLMYDFGEGYVAGSMRFNPVKTLGGTINVTFANLMEKINLNKTMAAESLFVQGEDRAKTIEVGNYDLILEGMQKQGAYYVLVTHVKNPAKDPIPSDKYFNREKAFIEAELHVVGRDGKTRILQGDCRTEKRGADILFPVGQYKDDLTLASIQDITLILKSVMFELPQISVDINLDNLITREAETLQAADAIEQAFTARLDYRAGIGAMGALAGAFSEDILSDFVTMKPYRPTIAYNPYVLNTAQVQLLTENIVQGQTKAYAIVYEYSDAKNGSPVFMNIHKVTAVKNKSNYLIVTDEVIEGVIGGNVDETRLETAAN